MKKSAFTLIELLVVIAIIAILAAIALPVFSKVLERGHLTNDMSNIRQIGIGLQAYQNDNDSKMPADQGGYFIVSSQSASNTIIFGYTGSSYAVWHSSFDPRQGTQGDQYPVSYSINEKVLTPQSTVAPGQWNGDFGVAVAPTSKIIVASPSFTGNPATGGPPAWGSNVASNVVCLPQQGSGMLLTGTFYKLMPSLFADSHVELSTAVNYQNGTGGGSSGGSGTSGNYVVWDPMQATTGTGTGTTTP